MVRSGSGSATVVVGAQDAVVELRLR